MTPIEKIDSVLTGLTASAFALAVNKTYADIENYMQKQYPELKAANRDWGLQKILDKLVKEGYVQLQLVSVETDSNTIEQSTYEITFDGQYFNQINGYKGQKERAESIEKTQLALVQLQAENMASQTKAQKETARLTLILAIGAIGALLVSIAALCWNCWKYSRS